MTGSILALALLGFLGGYQVPFGSMAPAVRAGDSILMEGITFRFRKPRRGDVVVFRAPNPDPSVPAEFYVKRIAGEPGERLHLSAFGDLCVNGTPVPLTNSAGKIRYVSLPRSRYLFPLREGADSNSVKVPEGHYFVLGDNSANSADSRFWGFLPAENILGRAAFCYRPVDRLGPVK